MTNISWSIMSDEATVLAAKTELFKVRADNLSNI